VAEKKLRTTKVNCRRGKQGRHFHIITSR